MDGKAQALRDIRLGKNISVVYEDGNIAVLNKPPGLVSIPAPGKVSLCEILDAACGREGLPFRLHPCHRIDGETSGLLVFARGKAAQKIMMELFRRREVKKTYIALVQGVLPKREGVFDRPLEGRSAATAYKVLEQRKLFAVVEARPETGRKNQIRLHFKAAGHPLVGETRFAFRRDFPVKVKRLMLHAARLEFRQPWTGAALCLEAPLPADMEDFLARPNICGYSGP
jgi:RluA family pseudouridine synthase